METRITVSNHTFNVFEAGNRPLPTLVCFHGMTGDINSFLGMIPRLKQNFHLVIFDLPGHGKSDPLPKEGDYMFTSIAKRIDQVMSGITKKPFYIMGHSWGANIALSYTKSFPERVKGVVMIDGGYVFPDHVEGMTEEKAVSEWEKYIDSSRYNTWDEVVKTYQEYTIKKWDEQLDSIIQSNFKRVDGEYVLKADRFSLLSTIKAFFKECCSLTLKSITCPLLLFHATVPEADPSIIKAIKAAQSDVKDIKIVGIENTKHNIHWDNPDAVVEELLLWKQENDTKFVYHCETQ